MIFENLPRRQGLSADARPAKRFDWTPGGRSWEASREAEAVELGAGSRQAGEIRMFNPWATGLRSGLLSQDCGVATPEVAQKSTKFERSFREGFDLGCQGMDLGMV